MNQYRKKPVVIEAITFGDFVAHGLAQPGANIVNGMPWSFTYNGHGITHENDDCYLIPTREGTMRFERGAMLITGIEGEIYPCAKSIFDATYESVDAEPKGQLIATGTPERPLIFVNDDSGHLYCIPADEEERFSKWVEYTEYGDEDVEWVGHGYDPLGSAPSCYKLIGEVRL